MSLSDDDLEIGNLSETEESVVENADTIVQPVDSEAEISDDDDDDDDDEDDDDDDGESVDYIDDDDQSVEQAISVTQKIELPPGIIDSTDDAKLVPPSIVTEESDDEEESTLKKFDQGVRNSIL